MTETPAPDPVVTSAGYLLLKAGHHIGQEFDAALARLGLSGREFLVLSFVGAAKDLSQQDLSERLGLDPTLVVGLVDALEERRWMTRTRAPADRRRNVLRLTAAGRTARTRAVRAAGEAEDRFLGPLGLEERETLRALLDNIMRHRLAWLTDVPRTTPRA
jgi:DNA-binding MarR family transcriptional regulator